MTTTFTLNGAKRSVDVDADTPLLWALRDVLGLTGTKFGCGMGLCGACTVHVDGQAVRACITSVESVGGKAVTTIEALGQTREGRAVQQAWLEGDVVQCGYCQCGQQMSASALLKANPKPSDAQIIEGMDGNLCRCGTYARTHTAVQRASQVLNQEA